MNKIDKQTYMYFCKLLKMATDKLQRKLEEHQQEFELISLSPVKPPGGFLEYVKRQIDNTTELIEENKFKVDAIVSTSLHKLDFEIIKFVSFKLKEKIESSSNGLMPHRIKNRVLKNLGSSLNAEVVISGEKDLKKDQYEYLEEELKCFKNLYNYIGNTYLYLEEDFEPLKLNND